MIPIHRFSFIFLLSILTFSTSLTSVFSQNLLAHFPMDGNTLDISGFNNLATNYGADPATDRFGNNNGALRFAENSDRILGTSNFHLDQFNIITVSLWIKREEFDFDAYNPHLIILGNNPTYYFDVDTEFAYSQPSPQYKDQFTFYNHDAFGTFNVVTHPTRINDTNWHHLMAIVNKVTKKIEFFVDGLTSGPITFVQNAIIGNDFSIGNHRYLNRGFIGVIDDVRIYNGAITPQQLYASVSTSNTSMSGLNLFIYPNPSYDKVQVECHAKFAHIDLISISGVVLQSIEKSQIMEFDLRQHPEGIYYIRATDAENQSVFKKLAIVR